MATKRSGTAVAVKKLDLPQAVMAASAAEIEAYSKRLAPAGGKRILTTASKTFKLPNGEESPTMTGIIVDFCAANYYYKTRYDPNNIVPPNCMALGLEPSTLQPVPNALEPQSKDCASCWANQWKSADEGNGKACANCRLLAILPPNSDVETDMVWLRISKTGSKAFDAHVALVARTLGLPIRGVVTKFTFIPDTTYQTVRFEVAEKVDADTFMFVTSRVEEAKTMLLTAPERAEVDEDAAPKKPATKPAKRAVRR